MVAGARDIKVVNFSLSFHGENLIEVRLKNTLVYTTMSHRAIPITSAHVPAAVSFLSHSLVRLRSV